MSRTYLNSTTWFKTIFHGMGWVRSACRVGWSKLPLLPLLVMVVGLGWPGNAIAFPRSMFIEQAQHQPEGANVIVTGNVTVLSGTFRSANLDEGFAIQDATGGIYVSTGHTLDLQLGEIIEVDGWLQHDGHGQRMLMLAKWQRRDRILPPIFPKMASAQEAGKQLEGQLVTVQGTIVQPLEADAPYGDRLWIEDSTGEVQIYIPKSTQISPQQLPCLNPGQTIQITGFSSQFDGRDEVVLRSRADIVELKTAPAQS